MKRRILSMVMTLAMLLTLLPPGAYAADGEESPPQVVVRQKIVSEPDGVYKLVVGVHSEHGIRSMMTAINFDTRVIQPVNRQTHEAVTYLDGQNLSDRTGALYLSTKRTANQPDPGDPDETIGYTANGISYVSGSRASAELAMSTTSAPDAEMEADFFEFYFRLADGKSWDDVNDATFQLASLASIDPVAVGVMDARNRSWNYYAPGAAATPGDYALFTLGQDVTLTYTNSTSHNTKAARYDGTDYETLQAALDAAGTEDATVTLLSDRTESVSIPEGAALTLDLGDCTLTGDGSKPAILMDGKSRSLTIKAGAGGVDGGDQTAVEFVSDSGEEITLSITGGSFTGTPYAVNTRQRTANGNDYNGASAKNGLKISGGVFNAPVRVTTNTGAAKTAITGGTFNCPLEYPQSSTYKAISGGRFQVKRNYRVSSFTVYGLVPVDGYRFTDEPDADGYYTVVPLQNAQWVLSKTLKFESFESALREYPEQAASSAPLSPLADITGNLTIPAGRDVLLDFTGNYSLTAADKTLPAITVEEGATLHLSSSKRDGTASIGADSQAQDGAILVRGTLHFPNDNGAPSVGSDSAPVGIKVDGGTLLDENTPYADFHYPSTKISGQTAILLLDGSVTLPTATSTVTGGTAIEQRGGSLRLSNGQLTGTSGSAVRILGGAAELSGASLRVEASGAQGLALEVAPAAFDGVTLLRGWYRSAASPDAPVTPDFLTAREITLTEPDSAGFRTVERPVATVGEVGYSTVSSALEAANGQEVKLLEDTAERLTLAAGKRAILDLNGCAITDPDNGAGETVHTVSGALTLRDSSAEGTGRMTAPQADRDWFYLFTVNSGGTLTIESGTYVASGCEGHVAQVNGVLTLNGGTLETDGVGIWASGDKARVEMNGGTIRCNNIDDTYASEGISLAGGASGKMTGGTIEDAGDGGWADYSAVSCTNADFEMTGGTLRCDPDTYVDSAIGIEFQGDGKTLTITGGSISGMTCDSVGSAVSISGYYGDTGARAEIGGDAVLSCEDGPAILVERNSGGSLTLSGGSFTGSGVVDSSGQNLSITGGSFVAVDATADTPMFKLTNATANLSGGRYSLRSTDAGFSNQEIPLPTGFAFAAEPDEDGLYRLGSSHAVTVSEAEGGSVTASAAQAIAGERVTLTAVPEQGFQLKSLRVYWTGFEDQGVTLEDGGFTMPSSPVTVAAEFEPLPDSARLSLRLAEGEFTQGEGIKGEVYLSTNIPEAALSTLQFDLELDERLELSGDITPALAGLSTGNGTRFAFTRAQGDALALGERPQLVATFLLQVKDPLTSDGTAQVGLKNCELGLVGEEMPTALETEGCDVTLYRSYTIFFASGSDGLTLPADTAPVTVRGGTAWSAVTVPAPEVPEGYELVWYRDETPLAGETEITESFTATARLRAKTYPVSGLADGDGFTLRVESGYDAEQGCGTYGTDLPFQVDPAAGWAIRAVSYSGASGDAVSAVHDGGSLYRIPGSAIREALTVRVDAVRYSTVTFAAGPGTQLDGAGTAYALENGTALYSSVAALLEGGAGDFTPPQVSALDGYRAAKDNAAEPLWYAGETGYQSSALGQSVAIPADITLTARAVKQWTVTFDPGAHGTLEGENTVIVDDGTPVSQVPAPNDRVSPNPGYVLDGWQFGAETVTGEFTVTMRYKDADYSFTLPEIEGISFAVSGAEYADGTYTARHDTDLTIALTVSPEAHIRVTGFEGRVGEAVHTAQQSAEGLTSFTWTVPGAEVIGAPSVVLSTNRTIRLTASAGEGGTVNGDTTATVTVDLTEAGAYTVTGQEFQVQALPGWQYAGGLPESGTVLTEDVSCTLRFAHASFPVTVNGAAAADATHGTDYAIVIPTNLFLKGLPTVVIGEDQVSVTQAEDGSYTIPGSAITGAVTVSYEAIELLWRFVDAEDYGVLPQGRKLAILNTERLSEGCYALTGYADLCWSDKYAGYVGIVDADESAESLGAKLGLNGNETVALRCDGDLNGNGSVTAFDTASINDAMHAVATKYTISDKTYLEMDVTGNGSVSTQDILWILQKAVGLVPTASDKIDESEENEEQG